MTKPFGEKRDGGMPLRPILREHPLLWTSAPASSRDLTFKTEGAGAENGTEVPHPSVQTTDGRMDHPPLRYRAGDSCLRHPPKGRPPAGPASCVPGLGRSISNKDYSAGGKSVGPQPGTRAIAAR